MKKIIVTMIMLAMAIGLMGCASGGVSQEEYNQVVEERDALKAQIESMSKETDTEKEPVVNIPTQEAAVDKENFVLEDVLPKLEAETLKYSSKYAHYGFLTIKNNSDYNVDITANVKFYDDAGNLIGAKSEEQGAVERGYDTILYFMPDEEFSVMEYELDVEETDWDCVLSDLSYEAQEAKNKIILSVTNNGADAADFVQASVLFFSGDVPVGFSQHYITDNDYELKPGKTISQEMDCFEAFDSYKVFFSGRR